MSAPPQTGTLLQCITGGGAGSTSCIYIQEAGKWQRVGRGRAGRLSHGVVGVVEGDGEFTLGVERQRVVVVLAGKSPGAERRDVDCARGVRDKLVALM